MALLNAVQAAMPHFPLQQSFEAELPPELVNHFQVWNIQSTL